MAKDKGILTKSTLYEDRIVVFIDILGFKQLIESTLDPYGNEITEKTHAIKYLLELASTIFKEHPDLETTKIVTQFSDSILISFHYTEPSQVFYTLLDILHLQLELVNLKQVVRGAVCFGKIHHTDNLVFGPGIVRAYEFETQSAIYPRIVVEPKVFDVGAKSAIDGHSPNRERSHIDELILKDFDGQYYVDYYANAQQELNEPNLDWPNYLSKLRLIIEKGLENKNPSVRNKFLWMKEKYNSLIQRYKSEKFLESVKEHLDPEFHEFYSSLEDII